jgi:hypothetical protein
MIEHLSAEQISQWMIGDRPWNWSNTWRNARNAAPNWDNWRRAGAISNRHAGAGQLRAAAGVARSRNRGRGWFSWPRLVLAAAALLVLVAVAVYLEGAITSRR